MFEMNDSQAIYTEVQDFKHPLIWILVAVFNAVVIGNMYFMYLMNKNVAVSRSGNELVGLSFTIFTVLMIIFLLFMNWFLLTSKLITEIKNDCLFIRFTPFFKRKIEYGNISNLETMEYSTFFLGGWGYHWRPGWRCYVAPNSDKSVIKLTLQNNLKIALSSKEPATIVTMIRDAAHAHGVDLQRKNGLN